MPNRTTTWISLAGGILGGLVVVAIILLLARPSATPTASATPMATATPTPAATAGVTAPVTAAPSAATTSTPSFAPSGTGDGAVSLIAAGDVASCTATGDSATARLVAAMPGTVAVLGDSVYPDGTRSQFSDCYDPTWGRFLDRTKPAPGNHEYRTRDAAGYFGYFGARAGDPARGWYAYDLGAWRVYALNSNCDEIGGCDARSAQVAWLRADLTANPRQCVLAYWHHPRYSSGQHGSQAQTDGLWDALYDAGAEIVLNGHDHTYERFAPQSDTGALDPERGIVEFVVGTGGFSHYDFPKILATSRVRDNTAFGVLHLVLAAGSWTARFVPIAGQTFADEASGTCH